MDSVRNYYSAELYIPNASSLLQLRDEEEFENFVVDRLLAQLVVKYPSLEESIEVSQFSPGKNLYTAKFYVIVGMGNLSGLCDRARAAGPSGAVEYPKPVFSTIERVDIPDSVHFARMRIMVEKTLRKIFDRNGGPEGLITRQYLPHTDQVKYTLGWFIFTGKELSDLIDLNRGIELNPPRVLHKRGDS